MTGVALVLIAGVTYRVTRLLAVDRITDRPRRWVIDRTGGHAGPVAYLLGCPWCLSVWVAALVAGSWVAWGDTTGWEAAAGACTASAAAGTVSTLVGD